MDDSILIMTDDGLTTMAIISNENKGRSIEQAAAAYSKAADGTKPARKSDD